MAFLHYNYARQKHGDDLHCIVTAADSGSGGVVLVGGCDDASGAAWRAGRCDILAGGVSRVAASLRPCIDDAVAASYLASSRY